MCAGQLFFSNACWCAATRCVVVCDSQPVDAAWAGEEGSGGAGGVVLRLAVMNHGDRCVEGISPRSGTYAPSWRLRLIAQFGLVCLFVWVFFIYLNIHGAVYSCFTLLHPRVSIWPKRSKLTNPLFSTRSVALVSQNNTRAHPTYRRELRAHTIAWRGCSVSSIHSSKISFGLS